MTPETVSAAQFRSMTREQLLEYILSHNSAEVRSGLPHGAKRSIGCASPPQKSKKRKKEFDMSRYGHRLVALRIAYEGWKFHGFASQIDSDNTVEHHLFAALLKTKLITSRETCQYSRSGRTDVGVSAFGQVIGIQLRSAVAPPSSGSAELDYPNVINSCLPNGIRVLEWSPVSMGTKVEIYDGDPAHIREYWLRVASGQVQNDMQPRRSGEPFSARFDATYRSYRYFFVRGHLDIKKMGQAAKYFEGKHDFRNFCRIDANVTNFERVMHTVEIRRAKDDSNEISNDEYETFYLYVKGQAFLWHQIRCMVAVLFDVGSGHEKPEIVKRMLDDATSGKGKFAHEKPQYRMASPTPLLLYECAYPNTVLHFPKKRLSAENYEKRRMTAFERAEQKLATSFSENAAKAGVLHAMLRGYGKRECVESFSNDIGETKGSKWKRNYVLDSNMGKHVPYEK